MYFSVHKYLYILLYLLVPQLQGMEQATQVPQLVDSHPTLAQTLATVSLRYLQLQNKEGSSILEEDHHPTCPLVLSLRRLRDEKYPHAP